jgi:hypothetical protein
MSSHPEHLGEAMILQLLLATLTCWINRHQQQVITHVD